MNMASFLSRYVSLMISIMCVQLDPAIQTYICFLLLYCQCDVNVIPVKLSNCFKHQAFHYIQYFNDQDLDMCELPYHNRMDNKIALLMPIYGDTRMSIKLMNNARNGWSKYHPVVCI
ncbi:unnamed protein product [Owenia fusiformis]|uniref:Uncharacterized protein n=1 Tax=Owenia fusiformis TaxID=6347 RepID=A0A8S4MYL1_OWEFU|nr:unnamed protein product [Owenia fusiformis]